MEHTERTLWSPGEESAPLFRSRDAREKCTLFKLGNTGPPSNAGSYSRRWRREGGAEDEQLAAHSGAWSGKQTVPVNRRQDLGGGGGSKGWTAQHQSK